MPASDIPTAMSLLMEKCVHRIDMVNILRSLKLMLVLFNLTPLIRRIRQRNEGNCSFYIFK